MINHFRLRLKSSVFVKLFAIIVVSGVFISLAILAGFGMVMRPKFDPFIHTNVQRYIRYLAKDMGEPPHFANGKKLAEELKLRIRIEGKDWSWVSGDDVPRISDIRHRPPMPRGEGKPPPPPRLRFFPFPGPPPGDGPVEVFDVEFASGPAKVLVMGPKRVMETDYAAVSVLVGFVLLVLTLGYLAMRWILRPLRTLNAGVEALARGDLRARVPATSSDELGSLGKAFNQMALRVSEMVDSKKQLLMDVSHELRSPLTRAKVGLELLESSEVVRNVNRDLDEVEIMIRTLLEEARLDSGYGSLDLQLCETSLLLKETIAEIPYGASRVKCEANSVTLECDPARMKSVLRNLIENALKYAAESDVTVVVTETLGTVRIDVTDRGVGIPAAELTKIFEPFYRTDASRTRATGGYGLGLSLCKKIVEAHGGVLEVRSERGHGTTISALLPKTRRQAA